MSRRLYGMLQLLCRQKTGEKFRCVIIHRSIKFHITTEFQTKGMHYTRGSIILEDLQQTFHFRTGQ